MRQQILRINVRGRGEGFFWTSPSPPINAEQLQGYLPRTADDLFGPNLAFTSMRSAKDTFFVTTVSRWYKREEFGRKGLTLAHGELIPFDPAAPTGYIDVCTKFLSIVKFHHSFYVPLGDMLETLATLGNEVDAKRLAEAAVKQPQLHLDSLTVGNLRRFADRLREELRTGDEKLRINLDLPLAPELGLCALIGLQAGLKAPSRAGGGHLDRLEEVMYLASSQEAPGFRYIDLDRSSAAEPPLGTVDIQPVGDSASQRSLSDPRPDGSGLARQRYPNTIRTPPLAAKLVSIAALLLTLSSFFSILLVVSLRGLVRDYKEQQQTVIRYLQTAVAAAESQPQRSPSITPREPQQPASSQELSGLVHELFDPAKPVRLKAFERLERGGALDPAIVGELLDQAASNKNNKEGVLLVLQFLERRDLGLLNQNREKLLRLLAEVRGNGPKTGKQVDLLQARLALPFPE